MKTGRIGGSKERARQGVERMDERANQTEAIAPTVSVVIATYKRAALLLRAIHSVLQQTCQDFEIVIVDDCSPDHTADAVRTIQDGRLRYLRHETNRGLPAGRNTGIAAARGQYVAFLDDDDEWQPRKLERQLQAIAGHEAMLTGALINHRQLKLHKNSVVTPDDLRRGCDFDPSSLLAKTVVLRELRFDESLRLGEDWDAFIRLAQRQPIGYVAEPLLLYNDGEHERMTNEARALSLPDLEKRMQVIVKHREFFGDYWFRYHTADTLLSYLAARRGVLLHVLYTMRRCGLDAVAAVLWHKVARRLKG